MANLTGNTSLIYALHEMQKRLKVLCSFFAIAILSCGLAINTALADPKEPKKILSAEEYAELSKLARAIEAQFPLKDYIYVGIGRGPTPIIRLFQEISPFTATNVPFRVPPSMFTSPQTEALFNHLQTFLPKSQVQAGRKILLISYDTNGETLKSFYTVLSEYFDRQKSLLRRFGMIPTYAILDRRVHSLALAPPRQETPISEYLWDQKHTIQSLRAFPKLAKKLAEGAFDQWAEFDSYNPATWPANKPLITRPEYAQFGEEMVEHMIDDEDILMLSTSVLRCTSLLLTGPKKPSSPK